MIRKFGSLGIAVLDVKVDRKDGDMQKMRCVVIDMIHDSGPSGVRGGRTRRSEGNVEAWRALSSATAPIRPAQVTVLFE